MEKETPKRTRVVSFRVPVMDYANILIEAEKADKSIDGYCRDLVITGGDKADELKEERKKLNARIKDLRDQLKETEEKLDNKGKLNNKNRAEVREWKTKCEDLEKQVRILESDKRGLEAALAEYDED